MKTNKKVVRLTESKLKQMIAEAVKETLNELDPRTYASAARKRQQQAAEQYSLGKEDDAAKLGNKANRLQRAAVDSYNRDYGSTMKDFDTMGVDRFMSVGNGLEHDIANIEHHKPLKGNYNPYEENPTYHVNTTTRKRNLSQKLFGGGKISHSEYNPSDDIEYLRGRDDNGEHYMFPNYKATEGWTSKRNKEPYRIAREMQNGTGKYNKEKGRWE